jgi:hypothetical protein
MRLAVGQSAFERGYEHQGRHREGPDESGHPRPGERGSERGRDDQQRPKMDIGRRVEIQHGDRHDQYERDRHQPAARWLLQEAITR